MLIWALNILPNKAGESYQRLYHEEWRSSQLIQATIEENLFRGFLGDYSMKLLQGSDVFAEMDFTLDGDLEITCSGDASYVTCA